MKFDKKASMQLSINMIVILIIAVVILGLALGFVKGMFGKMNKQFEGEAGAEPDADPATAGYPITMSRRGNILASPGEEVAVNWGVYCNQDTACTANLTISECATQIPTGNIKSTSISSLPVAKNDQVISVLKIADNAAEGTYICTATFGSIGSKDFTLKVMK